MDTPLLRSEIPGVPVRRGKVRDVYDLGDRLVIVASDRLSAFDWVLPTPIPGKGRILTALTLFWLDFLRVPNHLLSTDVQEMGEPFVTHADVLAGRTMLVRKTNVVPFECVVRGYLAGSGWKDYRAKQAVCGVPLPAGLREAERLPEPIFTPATKAEAGHDENVTFEVMASDIGDDLASDLRERSLAVYKMATEHAASRGIILADTKFEWGTVEPQYFCPNCGKPMIQRWSRRGPFLGCSGYPECKTTMTSDADGQAVVTARPTVHKCEKCGSPMVIREGRRGPFLACTGYPKCRNALDVDAEGNPSRPVPTGIKCEKCNSEMIVKKGPRGPYLACSGYPKCRSYKPLPAELRERSDVKAYLPSVTSEKRTEPRRTVLLIDEVLTPDSSRFWPADQYKIGTSPTSFDKQFVRDWLETTGWDKQSPPPPLPPDVVERTAAKYQEAFERLTG